LLINSIPIVTAPDQTLPAELATFLNAGKKKFRCDDGDWEVRIESVEEASCGKSLPKDSLIIANNGCGDYLYLRRNQSGSWEDQVNVFWHEGPQTEVFAKNIGTLTFPPPPTVSEVGPIYYSDGTTRVMLGDHVSVRTFVFFRSEGRVSYVPGISKRNRNMESNGLCLIGISHENGLFRGVWVDPDTLKLGTKYRFEKRSSEPVDEMKPDDDFE
jgi:hypothetical protein